MAAAGIFGGLELIAVPGETPYVWALWLGAIACLGLVVLGSVIKEYVVLSIAALGLTAFVAQLVGEYLGFGVVTSAALVLVGFTLLGTSVWLLRRSADDPKRSRPVVAEVAGYAGVAFAIGGAGMLLGEFWDELGTVGRIALPFVGSAYAYTCAVLVERAKTGSARRLSQLLFAIGAITAAAMVAMVARPIIEGGQPAGRMDAGVVESRTAFVGAIAGVIAGGVTWWFRKGVATQLVFIGATFMTVFTAVGARPA